MVPHARHTSHDIPMCPARAILQTTISPGFRTEKRGCSVVAVVCDLRCVTEVKPSNLAQAPSLRALCSRGDAARRANRGDQVNLKVNLKCSFKKPCTKRYKRRPVYYRISMFLKDIDAKACCVSSREMSLPQNRSLILA